MGAGVSKTNVQNTQEASAFITQQFAGTCDVQCVNKMSDIDVTLVNTDLKGGITFNQTCSSNPNCIIGSSLAATADILFKAANSANAANAKPLIGFNFDSTKIKNVTDIRENISQNTNQQCNISSVNEMSDISILAVNSTIGGGINLDQQGNASGNCQLTSSTNAAAVASGDVTNTARSGKGSNKNKSGKLATITNIAIIAAVVFVIYIIGKVISGNSKSSESAKEIAELTAAKVAAGCPGGAKPLMNQKTGEPLINPKTHGLYCPPPSMKPSGQSASSASGSLSAQSPSVAQISPSTPTSFEYATSP